MVHDMVNTSSATSNESSSNAYLDIRECSLKCVI